MCCTLKHGAVSVRIFTLITSAVAVGALAASSGSGLTFSTFNFSYQCVFAKSSALCSALLGLACALLACNFLLTFLEACVDLTKWVLYTVLYDVVSMCVWLALFVAELVTLDYDGIEVNRNLIRTAIAFSFLSCIPAHCLHCCYAIGLREFEAEEAEERYCMCQCLTGPRKLLIKSPSYICVVIDGLLSTISLGLAAASGRTSPSSFSESCVLGRASGSGAPCTLVIASSSANTFLAIVLFIEGLVRHTNRYKKELRLPLFLDAVRLVLAGGLAILQAIVCVLASMEWHSTPSSSLDVMTGAERSAAHTIIACAAISCLLWGIAFVTWLRRAYKAGQENKKRNSSLRDDTLTCGHVPKKAIGVLVFSFFTFLASAAVIVFMAMSAEQNKTESSTATCGLSASEGYCIYIYICATFTLLLSFYSMAATCADCYKVPYRFAFLVTVETVLFFMWCIVWALQVHSNVTQSHWSPELIAALTLSILISISLLCTFCQRLKGYTRHDNTLASMSNWHITWLTWLFLLSGLPIGLTGALGYSDVGECIFGGESFPCVVIFISAGISLALSLILGIAMLIRSNRSSQPFLAAVFASLTSMLALGVTIYLNLKWWGYSGRSSLSNKSNQVGNITSIASILIFLLWIWLSLMWWRDSCMAYTSITSRVKVKQRHGADQADDDESVDCGAPSTRRTSAINPSFANPDRAEPTGTGNPVRIGSQASRSTPYAFPDFEPEDSVCSWSLPAAAASTDNENDGALLEEWRHSKADHRLSAVLDPLSEEPLGHDASDDKKGEELDDVLTFRGRPVQTESDDLRTTMEKGVAKISRSRSIASDAVGGMSEEAVETGENIYGSSITRESQYGDAASLLANVGAVSSQRLTRGPSILRPGSWERDKSVFGKYSHCPVMRACWQYVVENLRLTGLPNMFDGSYTVCFCDSCNPQVQEGQAGNKGYWRRGKQLYIPPSGWCRFGIDPKVLIRQYGGNTSVTDTMFKSWPVAYHGTKSDAIGSIFREGKLVAAGQTLKQSGELIEPNPGHINSEGNIHPDFDHKQVFLTPCILYTTAYAAKDNILLGKSHMVALQVRVNPDRNILKKGPETLNKFIIVPEFPPEEMEWTVPDGKHAVIYGLLVCKVE